MFEKKQTVNLSDQYKKKQVNLLPDLYYKKKRRVRIVILIGFIVVLFMGGFGYQIVKLNNDLQDLKAQNLLVEKSIQEKEEERTRQTLLTALKSRIEFKVDLVKEIEHENNSVISVTDTIEASLPLGMVYVNVDFDSKDSISIYGRTEKEEEIPDFIHKLRMLNYFNEVKVDSISKTEYVNYSGTDIFYDFNLVCTFGGVDDAIDE